MIDAHRQAFIEEASELLTELETTLLELESVPDDQEIIAKVFRALHTIKGSSGMFGYDDITMFTHDIESVYDFIRQGKIKITKEIIDLTLAARDQISIMLLPPGSGTGVDVKVTREIIESFRNIANKVNAEKEPKLKIDYKSPEVPTTATDSIKTYRIVFKPSRDIFASGTNPVLLLNELKELGESICISKCGDIPLLENINPEKCYLSWEILLKTGKGIDAIKDVFIFVEDQCELNITDFDSENKLSKEEDFEDFRKLIDEIAEVKEPDLQNLILGFESSTQQNSLLQNVIETKKSKDNTQIHHEPDTVSSIRVSADKLDELVNLVGELVTIQARLSQIALSNMDPGMISVSEEVERITWSLRDSALNIRMLPIGTTFSKFKRLVRDLTKELGKEVELTTEGAETELDKTVIEKLNDPLIHIIRNSIDHGIESPAEREAINKNRVGTIQLSASQSGGNVLIKITDDGKGINKELIKEKAVKMGLTQENSDLSDSEIFSFIFAPGFSTASKVTNVSGRGVGMDVVRRAIDSLRGTVEVSSKIGIGTTITLKLPLTLAIIDGLLVKIEDDNFVLPLSYVEECVELSKADLERSHGRHIVNIRGEIVPYVNLRERFDIIEERPEIEQVVIADIKGMRVGFVVDTVIGQHQTVLKTLGKAYKNVEGVSGATILGDGTVALILDIIKLAEKEELEEKS